MRAGAGAGLVGGVAGPLWAAVMVLFSRGSADNPNRAPFLPSSVILAGNFCGPLRIGGAEQSPDVLVLE